MLLLVLTGQIVCVIYSDSYSPNILLSGHGLCTVLLNIRIVEAVQIQRLRIKKNT